jgi:ABC-type multidrug transport system ATPase subunit
VIILHQGRLVAQDDLVKLTSSKESSYDVRLKGDRELFLRALREEGLDGAPAEDEGVRIHHGNGTEAILRAAVKSGVQIRRLVRSQNSLEALFTKLVGGE